jgi:hypothetical protein
MNQIGKYSLRQAFSTLFGIAKSYPVRMLESTLGADKQGACDRNAVSWPFPRSVPKLVTTLS